MRGELREGRGDGDSTREPGPLRPQVPSTRIHLGCFFTCVEEPVSQIILRIVVETFVNLHAIEPTRSRGQRRVDGVGRLKFDFHTVPRR
jgi:hypothetical protein